MCNQRLQVISLIVLRKKNVVKRRTGCCAKRGQRQNALALDVQPRTKRVVSSRLEGKTVRFIGQILPHFMLGWTSWLSFPPCYFRFWGGEEEEYIYATKGCTCRRQSLQKKINRVLK